MNMFCAMRKGVKPCEFRPPLGKDVHRRFQQSARHALVPEGRAYSQRTEESDAAPVGQKVRSDQLALGFGAQSRHRISQPPCSHIFSVARESHRVRQANKCAKGQAIDAVRITQIFLCQLSKRDFYCSHIAMIRTRLSRTRAPTPDNLSAWFQTPRGKCD